VDIVDIIVTGPLWFCSNCKAVCTFPSSLVFYNGWARSPVTFDPNLFVARWYCGYVLPEDLPSFAADALEAGFDGYALRQLAGLVRPTSRDVGDLFVRSLGDMGLEKPGSIQEAILTIAKSVSKSIVDGTVDPFEGARRLSHLAQTAGYPESLAQFFFLTEELGIGEFARSRNLIRTDIVAEAEKLLAVTA